MKTSHLTIKILIVFCLIILMTGATLAITASIGNARMVLRGDVGDSFEKSIRVINTNDVAVDVELSSGGDLEDYILIKDDGFRLEPGKDKKAYFTLGVEKSGTTESYINIQFTPVEGGNGVGLTSTIIVIAGDGSDDSGGSGDGSDEGGSGDGSDDSSGSGDGSGDGSSVGEGNGGSDDLGNDGVDVSMGGGRIDENSGGVLTGSTIGEKFKINGITIALSMTLLIFLIFLIVSIISLSKQRKSKERKIKEGKTKPKKDEEEK